MKKWLKAALIVTAAATFTVALAACGSNDNGRPDNAYVVTFDYNEFNLAEGTTSRVQHIGVTAEDPYIYRDPNSVVKETARITFQEYYVYSWHLPQVDEAGAPKRGEDGRVLLGDKWDLMTDEVKGNMTLYANLIDKPTFTVKGGNEDVVFYGMPGDVLAYSTVNALKPSKTGHTFYKFYEDEGLTIEYTGSHTYEEGEHKNKVIYAKFLEGIWSIVTTPRQFNTAIGNDENIYLDGDIAFSLGTPFQPGRNYSGTIAGNEHHLTGIECTMNVTKANDYGGYGLFGVLASTAKITKLYIDNAKITFSVDGSAPTPTTTRHFGFLAEKAEAGCTLTDVVITGTFTKGTIAWEASSIDFADFLGEGGESGSITGCSSTITKNN